MFAASINKFGQVVANSQSSLGRAFLWTPTAANGTTGSLVDLGSLPANGTPSTMATGINDGGQVVGTTTTLPGTTTQAFLWLPTTPNGLSGSMVAVSVLGGTALGGTTTGINRFGQIIGSLNGSSFIWTPSSANGATGTMNTDSRLSGLAGINDFGQAVINMGSSCVGLGCLPLIYYPTIFTPLTPNGAVGSFTQVSGLTGAANNLVQAINNNGTVLGMSCSSYYTVSVCNGWHGFVWTPNLPNATTGLESTEFQPVSQP